MCIRHRVITEAELLANAADIDNASLSATNLQASSGTLTDNNDGTWDFTPAANDDTDVSFTYTVTDGIANVAGSAILDITPVNDIPTNTPVVLTPVVEDNLRVITEAELLANAADIDNASLNATNLQASSGTLTDNNDGTWDFTPAADDDTEVSFIYTVTDGIDDVAGSAILDITPVNDIPTNTPVVLTPVVEDNLRVITETELLANAADIDNASLSATNLQALSLIHI